MNNFKIGPRVLFCPRNVTNPSESLSFYVLNNNGDHKFIMVISVEHEVSHSQVPLLVIPGAFPNRDSLFYCVRVSVSIIRITDDNDSYF